jgi:acyl-CoA dehydrogenase
MNQHDLLDTTVARLFADLMTVGAPAQSLPPEQALQHVWEAVAGLGIPHLFLPEAAGGFNGSWCDAGVVFRRIGLHALPAPVGETLLAHRWLQQAGAPAPEGIITIGRCAQATLRAGARSETRFSGRVAAVPWGAQARWLLVAYDGNDTSGWALLPTASAHSMAAGSNAADEPRATLRYLDAPVVLNWTAPDAVPALCAAGALLRAGQMAGALETTLQLAVEHAGERHQFGRAIGKFQALQQQLAVLAEETAAASCAAHSACQAADGGDAGFEIAAAKLRANRAAAQATAIAHQVHGAIGFTREHPLHRFTLRLLAWRAEFGNDRHWADYLGRSVTRAGAGPLWQQLTARDARAPIGSPP